MSLYFHYYPLVFDKIYPKYTWRKHDENIYLTFDDGPIPEVTEWVLDLLKEKNIKATFFCVGNNIEKYPAIFQRIIAEGHSVGNHTYNHLNGHECTERGYVNNILTTSKLMSQLGGQTLLFRPPYGKITSKQARNLLNEGYEIVMWNAISGDFDGQLDAETCLQKSLESTKKGGIIVFHDSIKTFEKIKYVLPKYLDYFLSKGYRFKSLKNI